MAGGTDIAGGAGDRVVVGRGRQSWGLLQAAGCGLGEGARRSWWRWGVHGAFPALEVGHIMRPSKAISRNEEENQRKYPDILTG